MSAGYVPPQQQPPVYAPAVVVGTSGLAIASLVCGILWVGGLGAILAIVFGHVALSQIKKTGQQGRGLAIAGTVLGYVGTVGVVLLVLFAYVLGSAVQNNFQDACRQVGGATAANCR